jgi:NAD(P)-dependent dehydrogenase (short-subunit alcohol dehydrogenase family)
MSHPALASGNTAVITGAASGIGLSAACKLAALGMNIVLADLKGERLKEAAKLVEGFAENGAEAVKAIATDVSDIEALIKLEDKAKDHFGPIHVLMNNAAVQSGSQMLGPQEIWERVMAVNMWGVINGSRIFMADMIAHGEPALIINTGSKQGITTPPGDPAYNIAKAGVKVFTEALEHDLRNIPDSQISAKLLIPGFVWTNLTNNGQTEKPAAAWTADQTVDFMLESINRGDFYILCPDNDVPRATDERRIAWAAGDIVENRPPLSRWHPDYKDRFAAFLKGE